MTDFPVANGNPDAMFLAAATTLLGVRADVPAAANGTLSVLQGSGGGGVVGSLIVDPATMAPVAGAAGAWLTTPLVNVTANSTAVVGEYRGHATGQLLLQVRVCVPCRRCGKPAALWLPCTKPAGRVSCDVPPPTARVCVCLQRCPPVPGGRATSPARSAVVSLGCPAASTPHPHAKPPATAHAVL